MEGVAASTASGLRILRVDEGRVNERILAREAKVDYRRVEAASIKMPTRLASAEGKRMFARVFATLQLNVHFISTLARTKLDHEEVVRVETQLRERLEATTALVDKAIDGAEALFKAYGITAAATYDTQALDIDVAVLSSAGRRYLELIVKLDQLMPLLQTLEIHEVITTREVDKQRAFAKRQVKGVAAAARHLAAGLRKRMNAPAAVEGAAAAPEVAPTEPPGGQVGGAPDALSEPASVAESREALGQG